MPLYKVEHLGEESIYAIWRLEEDKHFFEPQVNLQCCPGFEDIHHEAKQTQWLAGRYLVKFILENYWKKEFLGLYNDAYGKPVLKGYDYFISLSNAKQFVTCIFHKRRPVGIDVEEIKEKIQVIAHKYLTNEERNFMGMDMQALSAAWCFKESLYKIHSKGNISLKEHIRLLPFVYDEKGGFAHAELLAETARMFTLKYFTMEGYMFAYNTYLD